MTKISENNEKEVEFDSVSENKDGIIIIGNHPPSFYEHEILMWGRTHDNFILQAGKNQEDKMDAIIMTFAYYGLRETDRKTGTFFDKNLGKRLRFIRVFLSKVGGIKGQIDAPLLKPWVVRRV